MGVVVVACCHPWHASTEPATWQHQHSIHAASRGDDPGRCRSGTARRGHLVANPRPVGLGLDALAVDVRVAASRTRLATRTSASGPHDDTASNSTRRTDVQNVRAHPHRATRARAPDHAPTRSRAGDVRFMHPAARGAGRHRRLLLLHVGNLVVVVGRNEPAWAMNSVITLRDYGLVPLMFAERGVRKRGRNKRRIRSCLTRARGSWRESASGSATSCCRSTSARRARGRQQVLRSRRDPRRRSPGNRDDGPDSRYASSRLRAELV